jgi:hypothetical protein
MADNDATGLTAADTDGGAEPSGRKPAGRTGPNGRRGGSRDPKVFVLLRELSEVHLLLDNVSANPHTTVAELAAATTPPTGLKDDWIEKVCEISWPPDGSNEDRAEDAALLIRAKDYLNRLSQPASGSTIAFTLLVTQEDAPRWWTRWFGWLSKRDQDQEEGHKTPREPTRSSLARAAYPDLVQKAEGFRRAIWWISILLVIALFVTCAVSWYVAYGNAALAELQTARETASQAQAAVIQAESGQQGAQNGDGDGGTADQPNAPTGVGAGAPSGQTARTPPPDARTNATGTQPAYVGYCNEPPATATQARLCEARTNAEVNVGRIEQRLASWLCRMPFTDCAGDKVADAPARAASLANIMGSAMLPFLYGLLGAGAAIIRSLSRKIKHSLLSPRDLHLSFQQLALGAVVGACIGLFVAAPDAGESGESLIGPVTLSASAISFVAGFGVEAVFQALEALITRIFNIAPAATGNRGDNVAGN